jgi:phosphoadenosine phosphosulfate reductase
MQDAVLVDLAVRADPDVEVVFLDTGFHFAETLETARRMRARYDLNLVTLRPDDGAASHTADGTEACCEARKVTPLDRHLSGRAAWVTGLRRAESPTRAGASTLEWDAGRSLVKVNPIVTWSDDDVARYVIEHDIIVNPLRDKGFDSIGCAPCTQPGAGRSGRWAGSGRLECGLHLVSKGG